MALIAEYHKLTCVDVLLNTNHDMKQILWIGRLLVDNEVDQLQCRKYIMNCTVGSSRAFMCLSDNIIDMFIHHMKTKHKKEEEKITFRNNNKR